MNKETGGPAFPVPDSEYQIQDKGMTLLDHFAGLAMQGDWAAQNEHQGGFANDVSEEILYVRAKVYYRMAEAMLLARAE
ncbi:hypothetical protein [Erwinia rhapontici]|uniref:hypothetical protein n=1 Tax=Erwinia rhapontici TaxID=55212 RepID=UPI00133154C7|nr:hypothetical protein [Erwinia rhapontici]MBP2156911.1 hypothetical protein [Erwinia rhapontici]